MAKRKRAAAGRSRTVKRAAKSAAGQAKKKTAKKTAGARKRSTQTKTARSRNAARAAASRSTKKTAVKKAATKRTARKPASRIAAAATKARGMVAAAVARVAGSFPWSSDENDPIVLLETDHRRFENLFAEGEETTERAAKGRTELLERLTTALTIHEMIEEKVLYPALKPHAESRDIVLEGYQEHHVADVLVKELHELTTDDEMWGAKFKVLKESIEHHIKEEENYMFPSAREVLTREELQDLGKRMHALKAEAEGRR